MHISRNTVKKYWDGDSVPRERKDYSREASVLTGDPEDIPKERVEHRLEGEDLVCPQCGDIMTEIGAEVVNKLKIIPAQTIVEQHNYYTYACQNCNKEDIETLVVKVPRERTSSPVDLPHRKPLPIS